MNAEAKALVFKKQGLLNKNPGTYAPGCGLAGVLFTPLFFQPPIQFDVAQGQPGIFSSIDWRVYF